MKLILIFSTQFGKFVPDFMLPLLYRGYCMFEQDLGCDRLHTMVKKKNRRDLGRHNMVSEPRFINI